MHEKSRPLFSLSNTAAPSLCGLRPCLLSSQPVFHDFQTPYTYSLGVSDVVPGSQRRIFWHKNVVLKSKTVPKCMWLCVCNSSHLPVQPASGQGQGHGVFCGLVCIFFLSPLKQQRKTKPKKTKQPEMTGKALHTCSVSVGHAAMETQGAQPWR